MNWNVLAMEVETEFVFWRQGQEESGGRETGFQEGMSIECMCSSEASANRAPCFLEGRFVK